jgi:large subunit ribosomal protein L35
MPKQKTHKGLRKRVKITATGKVRRKRSGGGHLMSGKSSKRRRRIGSPAILSGVQAETFKVKLSR